MTFNLINRVVRIVQGVPQKIGFWIFDNLTSKKYLRDRSEISSGVAHTWI